MISSHLVSTIGAYFANDFFPFTYLCRTYEQELYDLKDALREQSKYDCISSLRSAFG